jgi:hypothetical protein
MRLPPSTAWLLLLALWPGPVAAQMSVGQVKGIFIERFTRFIEWPASALPADQPFQVCIQGSGETADDLARVAASRKFKDRPCRVRRLTGGAHPGGCHVLFVAGSEWARLGRVLQQAEGQAILTVADSPGFAQRGVHINLYQEGRFMRFEINTAQVRDSPLTFSSQLLRLGRPVGPAPEAGP